MRPFFNNKRGMTLVEVIVATALVSMAVVSIGALITQSSVFSNRIDTVYTASYLAQRRIELLKRLDFSQISSAVESDLRVGVDGNINANGGYVRTTEVSPNFGGDPHLTKVKVTVKRLKIDIGGGTGAMVFSGQPVVMETLFTDTV
ncbi:MAG: type II secretion system protein [Candidatus Omnitrophota bacterium]